MRTRLSKRRHDTRDHEAEAWALAEAVCADRWLQAGLNREVIDGGVAGYWKRQRCGCLFVVEVVEPGFRNAAGDVTQ
jgi:hypothetical protein